jgi:DNA-binding NarL/FixJ family response regulator
MLTVPIVLSCDLACSRKTDAKGGFPRVIVLKNDLLYLDAVSRLLREKIEGATVLGYSSITEAGMCMEKAPVDLLVSGLMSREEGLFEALGEWKLRGWVRRILIVTGRKKPLPLLDALALPVEGILDAEHEGDVQLVVAVRELLEGRRYFSATMTNVLAEFAEAGQRPDRILTPTQRRALSVLGAGHDDIQASYLLKMSPHTVRKHREVLYRKLDVNTRQELVRAAKKWGV